MQLRQLQLRLCSSQVAKSAWLRRAPATSAPAAFGSMAFVCAIALLPCMLADVVPQLRRLTPSVICSRSLCVAYRRESALSDNVRAVVQLVSQVVTENAALISGARAS